AATDTPAQSAAFIIDTTPPALAEGVKLDALRIEADKPLLLSWKEPLQTLEVTVGDKPIAVELSGEGTQATLQPDPELLQGGQPVTLRIRAVDRAGTEFVGEGTLLPLAKPPEAPAPKAPAPKAEPAAPTPKAAAMPGGSLKQRYQGTLARDTGYVLDELYLNDRGPFFETPGFAAGGPQEPPRAGLYPSLAYPHSYLRAVEDPFFRRHSVTREEDTPIPGSGESARGQDN
ncbi:MAG: hypothetical protein O7A69_05310, partial [SAR324 cluster bacterium]|nr:hypothetical protein [SAR324 cluster bacterium]